MKNTAFRLVQITDTHVRADSEGTLMGFQTQTGLELVLEKIRQDPRQPDAIVVTGDIAHDFSETAYRNVANKVLAFGCPVHWCPGNHDDKPTMKKIAQDLNLSGEQIHLGIWLVQLLDSAVPGKVYGHLSEQELLKAKTLIATQTDRYLLFGFHHQPVKHNSRWIDALMINNGDALMALVDQQPHVRGLFWGHVHQELDRQQGGLRLMSTPSTCVQFTPESDDFSLDRRMPGYRWFDLYPDGRLQSAVVRIDPVEMDVDFEGDGY